MLTYHHTKCLKCWYDLYGSTSPVCPECGTDKFKLPKSRRKVEPLRRLASVDSRVRSDTMPIAGFLVAAFTASIAAIVWFASSGHLRSLRAMSRIPAAWAGGGSSGSAFNHGNVPGFAVEMVAVAAGTFAATLVLWFGTIWAMGVWKAWAKAERQRRRAEMLERRRSKR